MITLRLSDKSQLEKTSLRTSSTQLPAGCITHKVPSPLWTLGSGAMRWVYISGDFFQSWQEAKIPKRSPTAINPQIGNRPKDYCEESRPNLLTPRLWRGIRQSWMASREGQTLTAPLQVPEGSRKLQVSFSLLRRKKITVSWFVKWKCLMCSFTRGLPCDCTEILTINTLLEKKSAEILGSADLD